jgi:hypothetical protein
MDPDFPEKHQDPSAFTAPIVSTGNQEENGKAGARPQAPIESRSH